MWVHIRIVFADAPVYRVARRSTGILSYTGREFRYRTDGGGKRRFYCGHGEIALMGPRRCKVSS